MDAFQEVYDALNAEQKHAVDTTEGPLLVIAGPGTGKTQLLGARVANILQKTDTPAQNILCLTFTESGAANMRQRLTRFIGQEAYNVTISTYHAFGSDLISRYPEYYADMRLQTVVDDLGKRQILLEIVEAMSYRNPLKQTRHHLGDLVSTISELKRALLSSADLRKLAAENMEFISKGSKKLQPVFQHFTKMPSRYDQALPFFEKTSAALAPLVPAKRQATGLPSLSTLSVHELQSAIDAAAASTKTTELTKWKNKWLAKNTENEFVLAGELENRRITALASVLDNYQEKLAEQGLFDYDDMILRSIDALNRHAELRYTLQERYLYILLDEFQDTNAAQLKLVELLTNNPVHEGRPNIMAVGDDDQAIYAFQGAEYSNMLEFYRMYRGTTVINLTKNYRSHPDILTAAGAVTGQIENRLQDYFKGANKRLIAANSALADAVIERREFKSDIAERAWIASSVKRMIDGGTAPSEIAVLSPKHKHIEPLVHYLNAHGVPVRYEKRENILEAPVIRQLITISRLILATAADNQGAADALWPQVLSYEFWQIPTELIWRISWKVSDSWSDETGKHTLSWNKALLDSDNPDIQLAARVILSCAGMAATEKSEMILDYLTGTIPIGSTTDATDGSFVKSPLRAFYMSPEMQASHPEIFYETISHLTVLRARLAEYQDRADSALMLADLIRFVGMYEAAEQPMIDTSPYSQQADSVQLLTVFKAKGMEYEHVFLPGCLDDIWGTSSRGNTNKLTLPANLQPIRHAGTTDDERLRILFVALTRAKIGLHLSSSTHTFSGKATKRLKYFDEQEQADGSFRTLILPKPFADVISEDTDAPMPELLAMDWQTRHIDNITDVSLASLLSERLENYRLSPTHLVKFVDLEYAGPQQFFFDDILKFPSMPTADSQFGLAIHETLEWYQQRISERGYSPTTAKVLSYFEQRIRAKKLTEQRTALEIERGRIALSAFLKQRGAIFTPDDVAEKKFYNEGVFYGNVRMSGRIDRMEINKADRTMTVVDYKTGKSYSSWKSEIRLHRYKLQLYAYKLLIEGSRTYSGYKVPKGRLEFIESDSGGRVDHLELTFEKEEEQRIKKLMDTVWQHVHALRFPDTADYPPTLAGIRQFEADLIDGKI